MGMASDLIDDLQQLSLQPAVVVMTGHGADYAEQAIVRGADDFLNKPFDAARLRVTLLNAAEKQKLSRQVANLSVKREQLGSLGGQSSTMQTVFETVESLAGTVATAFVMGESGTERSSRLERFISFLLAHPGLCVVVDCSALGC